MTLRELRDLERIERHQALAAHLDKWRKIWSDYENACEAHDYRKIWYDGTFREACSHCGKLKPVNLRT